MAVQEASPCIPEWICWWTSASGSPAVSKEPGREGLCSGPAVRVGPCLQSGPKPLADTHSGELRKANRKEIMGRSCDGLLHIH